MGLREIAAVAMVDPVRAGFLVAQRLSPDLLIDRMETLGERVGLRRPAFLLSFDCDTERDIEVAWDVHSRLVAMGIRGSYAVPGELLERGASVWRRIAETGAEFLNHGYREHTVYRDGAYVSTVFYDRMPWHEVEADIVAGDAAVARVLGRKPGGFRTPHFGSFHAELDLLALHRLLQRLGYRYSSSTMPYQALRHGPFSRRFGLVEIPVSGCPDYPMMILDSYGFRFTAGRFGAADYIAQANKWAALLAAGRNLFVNLYVDPSQVAEWDEFFHAMKSLAPYAVDSFGDILEVCRL